MTYSYAMDEDGKRDPQHQVIVENYHHEGSDSNSAAVYTSTRQRISQSATRMSHVHSMSPELYLRIVVFVANDVLQSYAYGCAGDQ